MNLRDIVNEGPGPGPDVPEASLVPTREEEAVLNLAHALGVRGATARLVGALIERGDADGVAAAVMGLVADVERLRAECKREAYRRIEAEARLRDGEGGGS